MALLANNKGIDCGTRSSHSTSSPPACVEMGRCCKALGGVLRRYKDVTFTPWIILWILMTCCLQCALSAKSSRKNVLVIISDDLRPQLDIYEDLDTGISPFPKMYTPNINELASKSLVLGKAYCQVAICSPSRTSFLTARRPETTKVHDSQTYFRDTGGDFTTLPQYFKDNGYLSIGMGKVFHPGRRASKDDDPVSWTNDEFPYFHPESERYWRMRGKTNSYLEAKSNTEESRNLNDEKIAEKAVDTLTKLAEKVKSGDNFFMAVGFKLPHLPFVVPSQYLQYYPIAEIQMPKTEDPPTDMPNVAWFTSSELREYEDLKQIQWRGTERTALPNDTIKDLRRYYYASVTYVDYWIGQVLKTLEDKKLSENTIVVFMSDHGYQLGEHGLWTKNTNFEIALQVPLMIHVPGLTKTSTTSLKLVELIDLFPTLVDLAGLPALELCSANATVTSLTKVCREGSSFRKLFDDPNFADGKQAAFSQIYRKPYQSMGYSVRTSRYRFTEWVRYNMAMNEALWDQPLLGQELYDHMLDPDENTNLVNGKEDMSTKILIQEMSGILRGGWRSKKALPRDDWPMPSLACELRTLSNLTHLCLYLVVLTLRFCLEKMPNLL